MDRHCSRQSPYQPSAGQVYLDYLRLKGPDDGVDERSRALELSVRPLSASELEQHHKRKACLKQHDDDRWAKMERIRTVERHAVSALHECTLPPAKINNGKGNTNRQLSGEILQPARPKPRPCPLDLTSEHLWRQRSLGPRREQRGYFEFEIADQKRRVARMGLGGQKSHEEGAIPQTTHPLRIPKPTNHLFPRTCAPKEKPAHQMQEHSKGQEQQSEIPACGQWVRERTNNALPKAGARQEAGQRKLAHHSLENQKLTQQKREQQKVQLPAAKPGNQYPGPTRISSILPPTRLVHDNNMEQSTRSELALSVHLKAVIASQEAYSKYKEKERKKEEEEEEQRKAALSIPRSEATRTESVKQLLASVNKALEQKVEAAEVEAAKTNIAESEVFGDQSPEPFKGPGDAYEAGLKCGENFWHRYDKSYPISRPPDGIHCPPNLDSASSQALIASSDCRVGAKELAHDTGPSQREVPLDSSPSSKLRAAVEAIEKTSGDLLESPKTTSGQHKAPLLEPSAVSISRDKGKPVVHVAGLSRAIYKGPSLKMPRQDVSPPTTPKAEQTDMSSEMREDEEGDKEIVDIQSEWEEVDDSLENDGWSDVEQDFVDDVGTGSSSSSDVEWASDFASEGAIDF